MASANQHRCQCYLMGTYQPRRYYVGWSEQVNNLLEMRGVVDLGRQVYPRKTSHLNFNLIVPSPSSKG